MSFATRACEYIFTCWWCMIWHTMKLMIPYHINVKFKCVVHMHVHIAIAASNVFRRIFKFTRNYNSPQWSVVSIVFTFCSLSPVATMVSFSSYCRPFWLSSSSSHSSLDLCMVPRSLGKMSTAYKCIMCIGICLTSWSWGCIYHSLVKEGPLMFFYPWALFCKTRWQW